MVGNTIPTVSNTLCCSKTICYRYIEWKSSRASWLRYVSIIHLTVRTRNLDLFSNRDNRKYCICNNNRKNKDYRIYLIKIEWRRVMNKWKQVRISVVEALGLIRTLSKILGLIWIGRREDDESLQGGGRGSIVYTRM